MSHAGTVRDVADRLSLYPGVPSWWAEVFVNMGFSSEEAETYVVTASKDRNSPLARANEAELNATLRAYAEVRGVELLGAGGGPTGGKAGNKPFIHTVSTVCTPVEQDAVVREVSGFADVRFKEKMNGVYTAHAVGNAVRSVHEAYLHKLVPPGVKVLNLGASVRAMVTSEMPVDLMHGCCPVLDVRDSVRHSMDGFLGSVVRPMSSYSENAKAAARAAMDPGSGFICHQRAEHCSWGCEYIVSNESTHDIEFDDLPHIMSRHGARVWIGFATRARGLHRSTRKLSGICSVMGTRWSADPVTDKISFHFDRSSSFGYEHRLSQWMKYEERSTYRWRGKYFDYVYTRMPITTAASLAFMIVRVPKVFEDTLSATYVPTGLKGMAKVSTIKAVSGCVGAVPNRYKPFEFYIEDLVWDKIMEQRLMLGTRGNLVSTISYLRSARVRLMVNGVALGAEQRVPVDVLESAAVAVELLAADSRMAMDSDFASLMKAAVPSSHVLSGMAAWLSSCTGAVTERTKSVCKALMEALTGDSKVVVTVERCKAYTKVIDSGVSTKLVENLVEAQGCPCDELKDVNAALALRGALTVEEICTLEEYKVVLSARERNCRHVDKVGMDDIEVEEVVFDSSELDGHGSDSGYASLSHDDQDEGMPSGFVVDAIREYADWTVAKDKAARSEAAVFCSILFSGGNPTLEDIVRSTTGRTRHAVLAVEGGAIKTAVGSMVAEDDYAELYCRSLGRTCKVYKNKFGSKYVKENITELCYTSTGLQVMNGEALARGSLNALVDVPAEFAFPKYLFVNGVPGCGKTYEMIQIIKSMTEKGQSVLYLTETAASADEVFAEAYGGDVRYRRYCATYGSYLCSTHKVGPLGGGTFDMLLCDEVPMSHAGAILACMLSAGAKDVRMAGDRHQINADSYMADYVWSYSKLWPWMKVEERYITHRFGATTCAMWLDVYGRIFPCDCHEHDESMPEVIRLDDNGIVMPKKDERVLSYTQEEKSNLKRELGLIGNMDQLRKDRKGGLSTVGEDQGGTHGGVILVRMVNRKNPKESLNSPSIYNRQPWVIVATTRGNRPVKYYTNADADMTVARIRLAGCPVRIDAVKARVEWKNIKKEALQPPEFGGWGVVA